MRHHASVFAFKAHSTDVLLTLRLECPECLDAALAQRIGSPEELVRLLALADEHNRAVWP